MRFSEFGIAYLLFRDFKMKSPIARHCQRLVLRRLLLRFRLREELSEEAERRELSRSKRSRSAGKFSERGERKNGESIGPQTWFLDDPHWHREVSSLGLRTGARGCTARRL